jgi:hypothetical protein
VNKCPAGRTQRLYQTERNYQLKRKYYHEESDSFAPVTPFARFSSTNPGLTSAQRWDPSNRFHPLVRDTNALGLDVFEALMSVTNIASSGEDAKTEIA